jgi:hypothetical protein
VAETANELTAELLAWMGSVLPDVPAVAQPLGLRERKPGIDLRLVRAAPRPTPRTSDPPALVDVDYLITVQLPDAAAEQRAIVELLFAVADRAQSEVVPDQNVAELCGMLGIPVGPGFILRAPLVRAPQAKMAPRVRGPVIVHSSELGMIAGTVVGPGDIPVAGAAVSARGLNRSVSTDRNGQFKFVSAPGGTSGVRLVARARGVEVEGTAVAGQTVTLRLPLEG